MKRSLTAALILVALTFAGFAQAQKNQPQMRELLGHVTDRADAPLPNAIVYLKNTRTLTVKTFITGNDGKYRFPSLAQNVDYDVYAEYQGKRSDTKTLSSFDSRTQAYINLKVDASK
ncbi:MAG: carboxypeptidase regulatory-like domain-containing protein [Terriglobales bacterium]